MPDDTFWFAKISCNPIKIDNKLLYIEHRKSYNESSRGYPLYSFNKEYKPFTNDKILERK